MSDLFEDAAPPGNSPEFTVSELSGAVKRVIEGEFKLVRVRGEVGRLSRPASGHLYFALKDDRASLDAVSGKGQVARMQLRFLLRDFVNRTICIVGCPFAHRFTFGEPTRPLDRAVEAEPLPVPVGLTGYDGTLRPDR